MHLGAGRVECVRLSGLGGDQRRVLLGQGDHLRGVRQGAVQGVGQGGGKGRGQQIDVELQIPRGVEPVHRQGTAAPVGGTEQVESDGPHGRCRRALSERPALLQRNEFRGAPRGGRLGRLEWNDFSREQFELQFEAVEVVAAEGRGKNPANLIVVARDFEFFGGAADGQVVDEDLRLIEGAVGDAGQFAEFEVAEMLNADPDADAKHGEHQAERTSGRPQQEQAQHGEDGGDSVEENHDLAVRHAMLQQFVVDVLAVGGEDGASADQAADDGERRFQNRQAERNDRDRDGNDGRSLLRALQAPARSEQIR